MPTTPRPKRSNGTASSARARGASGRRPARDGLRSAASPADGADASEGALEELHEPDVPSEDVLEFLKAVDDYKRKSARPFPSLSEYLRILRALGYRKS